MTIPVRYSCHVCGLVDVVCHVTARTTEDVVTWTRTVMTAELSYDHRKRSPHCTPRQLSNIKVPISGANRIGEPPAQ